MSKNFNLRMLSSLFLSPIIIFLIYKGGTYFYSLLLFVVIFAVYEIANIKNLLYRFIISIIFFFFIYCCYKITALKNGEFIFLYLIILTWVSDIGGYIFGKLIGGKKLKIISPNKTYAGFFGSLILTQILALILNYFNFKYLEYAYLNHYFVLHCTISVILGDLLFSYFKRKCNLKDFSNLIPGHGGLFDRIDGLIVLTIFIFILKL